MSVATIGHVAHAWLLLAPTAAMSRMTSDDRCYCGAHGTREVAISAHSSDGLFEISEPLLLPQTIAIYDMTSDDRCYCWPRGTRAVAISTHSNDGVITLVYYNNYSISTVALHCLLQ
jgi:hypothetical protein